MGSKVIRWKHEELLTRNAYEIGRSIVNRLEETGRNGLHAVTFRDKRNVSMLSTIHSADLWESSGVMA